MITFLKRGESVPSGTPRRYVNGQQYVRLRWKVGRGLYVEVWEHRVKDGIIIDGIVHHKNHNKQDNSTSNLQVCRSHREHNRQHRRINRDVVLSLHHKGLTRTEIANAVGTNPGGITRMLREFGIPDAGRPFAERHGLSKLTRDIVTKARVEYANGETLKVLASRYGVTISSIHSAIKGKTWGFQT